MPRALLLACLVALPFAAGTAPACGGIGCRDQGESCVEDADCCKDLECRDVQGIRRCQ